MADFFRSQKPLLPLELVGATAQPAASVEDLVAKSLQTAQVAQAMRTLSPERAEALALRFFGGLSFAEAGIVMGKSEAAVKMLVQRSLGELRRALTAREAA